MKNLMVLLQFLLISFLFLSNCGNSDKLAGGGGSSETQNGITGLALGIDQKPIAHAEVILRPADYLSEKNYSMQLARQNSIGSKIALAKQNHLSYETVTDAEGRYSIDSIQLGHYRLEIRIGASASLLDFILAAPSSSGPTQLENSILKPFATVSGLVPLSELKDSSKAFIQIYGLERLIPVNQDGQFTISDLPEGDFKFRLVITGKEKSGFDFARISTISDSIQTVSSYQGWSYSSRIFINSTSTGVFVSESLYNFPLLIRLTSSDFNFSQTKSDGTDIRFSKADGIAIPFEIDYWDSTAGKAAIWVLLDTLYSNRNDQHFFLYWGNSSALNRSASNPVFAADTNALAVLHLSEDPQLSAIEQRNLNKNSVPSGLDSLKGIMHDATGNGHFGKADFFQIISTEGVIGRAVEYTSNNYRNGGITIVQPYGLQNKAYTWSAWVRPTQPQNQACIIGEPRNNSRLTWGGSESGQNQFKASLVEKMIDTASQTYNAVLSQQQVTDQWYFVAVTASKATKTITLYINGQIVGTKSWTNDLIQMPGTTEKIQIGGSYVADEAFIGKIDEVHLSSEMQSEDWIRLSYENQKPQGSLLLHRE